MEQLSDEILNAFGEKVVVIKKIQRYGIYVCKIDRAEVCIKRFRGTEEMALYIHNIKKLLKSKNFNNIEEDILTIDGEVFFKHNGDIYICYKKVDGEKFDITNSQNILFLVSELGRLHNCLNSTYIENCISQKFLIKSNYENFKKIKKQVTKNKKKNDIDFFFLKMYNKYEGMILESIKELEFLDFENYENMAISLSDICFNSFDENNFAISNKGLSFKDFTFAKSGCQLLDLSKLIYKYVKVCYEENVETVDINYLIESYRASNELTTRELLIFKAILNYPEKYINNMNRHYEKKRSFVPTETVAKLDKYLKIEEIYYRYINTLRT